MFKANDAPISVGEAGSSRLVPVLALLTLAALSSGCAPDQRELDRWIAEVKARPGPPLEPLPVIRTFETFEYQAFDLRDPFSPSRGDEEEVQQQVAAADSGPKPDFNRPREFLESFPLDSLRMVGTLAAEGNFWGLVQDPQGVIHRVQTDNYLGQNHGRIESISEVRIEVVELIPNNIGGWLERQAALALDGN